MEKRSVDVVVISDVHLGTYACRAAELVSYLRSINPRLLVLNGDIVDGWQFSKHYFPADHLLVIQEILALLSAGTRVIYVTGNHDEVLRRYTDLQVGNFQLTDKILLEINGKTTWIFHGDVFDHASGTKARFITRLGSNGYAILLAFNFWMNRIALFFGGEKISLAARVMKQFNKRFVRIDAFENLVAAIAISKKYDSVICGHIHQPQKREISNEEGSVVYLNSGDWVEHLTALEYRDNDWQLYTHQETAQRRSGAGAGKNAAGSTAIRTEVLPGELAIFFQPGVKKAII